MFLCERVSLGEDIIKWFYGWPLVIIICVPYKWPRDIHKRDVINFAYAKQKRSNSAKIGRSINELLFSCRQNKANESEVAALANSSVGIWMVVCGSGKSLISFLLV